MPITSTKLLSLAIKLETQTDSLVKISYIKQIGKNLWRVFSEKGKNLGTFPTQEKAKKRLRQVEFFKHRKASKENEDTYSSIMRSLNKKEDQETMKEFQSTFKKVFDKAWLNGDENPEVLALEEAKECLASNRSLERIKKLAEGITLGDPIAAGQYLANIIKFMTSRISQEKRQHSLENLKKKIYYLNEYDMAEKRTPASSSLGQAITLTKHLLLGNSPDYIRKVLNATIKYL